MKVVENREEPFKKEEKAFYVKDDNRARIDKWRNYIQAKGFVRSESNPRYFRMTSRSNYVRDRSNFGRQNLNARSRILIKDRMGIDQDVLISLELLMQDLLVISWRTN